MTDFDFQSVEKGLKELFNYAFTTNCHLDEASCTSEELRTLEELDSSEILENFKDVVTELLNFKREHRNSDTAELVKRAEGLESMLQKLENEVRSHIRVEHQLKLHIESTQSKLEEVEKRKAETEQELKKLKLQTKGESRTQNIDSKLKHIENKFQEEINKINKNKRKSRKDYEAKIQNLGEIADNREKHLQKLEQEANKLKLLLEEKTEECNRLKKENQKLIKELLGPKKETKNSSSVEALKKKLEERSNELNKLQSRLGQKVQEKKHAKRSARRSLGEMEFKPTNYATRKEHVETIKKEETKPKRRSSSRGHTRTHSEHPKSNSSKRVPSR